MYRERLYSAEEVRGILMRAAALQSRDARGEESTNARALSLVEIQRLAADIGVGADIVVRAVEDPDTADEVPGIPWHGVPARVVIERTLAEVVSEQSAAELVDVVRRAFGDAGRIERVGASIAWTTTLGMGRQILLTIVPRASGTTLRLEESFRQYASQMYGGIGGGVGGGGLGLVVPLLMFWFRSPWIAATVSFVYVAALFLVIRGVTMKKVYIRRRDLLGLMDRLVHIGEHPVLPRHGPEA